MNWRRSVVLFGVLFLTCVSLRSETIYSNFELGVVNGTGGGFEIGCCYGPGPFGAGFFAIAVPFVPNSDFTVDTIRIPITSHAAAPLNQFTFEVRDGLTQPGAVLERYARALVGFSVVELNSSTHPVLYAGRRYWIVVSSAASGEWGWGGLTHPPGTVLVRNTQQIPYWGPLNGYLPGVYIAGTPTVVRPPTTLFETGGSVPHILSGGGWQTTIQLINTGSAPATADLNFFDETGSPLSLSLVYSLPGRYGDASSIKEPIPGGATISITISDTGPLREGHARFTSTGGVGASTFIRYNPTGQEVGVPLETRSANSYLLAFDQANGATNGIAVANLSAFNATIPVTIRDAAGALLDTGTVTLPPFGQASFMLSEKYARTKDKLGSIEFATPEFGSISLFGLRMAPTDSGHGVSMTAIPVVTR